MSSKRILVVDDDSDIRTLVVGKLTRAGIQVDQACDGKEGFESIVNNPPDLVLLDMMMPEMTGIEVCERLRAEHSEIKIPVVFLTAKAHGNDVQQGLDSGALEYIVKPFSPRELLARVEELLLEGA